MSEESQPGCVEFEPDRLERQLEVEVPGHYGAISPVVERVLGIVAQIGCGVGKEFQIETALREGLANAIRHGCGGDPEKRVQVCVACDEHRGMLIVIRDPGPGFDPQSVTSPVAGQSLFSEHGRGIFLINELMDHVSFERGGTEIRMRKR